MSAEHSLFPTGEAALNAAQLPNGALGRSRPSAREITGHLAAGHIAEFGPPLNVIAGQTIRTNYRRIRDCLGLGAEPGRFAPVALPHKHLTGASA